MATAIFPQYVYQSQCQHVPNGFRAVQRSASCRSRRELSNAYLLANFGFDTAENSQFSFRTPRYLQFLKIVWSTTTTTENEPAKVCRIPRRLRVLSIVSHAIHPTPARFLLSADPSRGEGRPGAPRREVVGPGGLPGRHEEV